MALTSDPEGRGVVQQWTFNELVAAKTFTCTLCGRMAQLGAVTLAAADAPPSLYRSYCLTLRKDPDAQGGVGSFLSECANREGAVGSFKTNLQRLKFG